MGLDGERIWVWLVCTRCVLILAKVLYCSHLIQWLRPLFCALPSDSCVPDGETHIIIYSMAPVSRATSRMMVQNALSSSRAVTVEPHPTKVRNPFCKTFCCSISHTVSHRTCVAQEGGEPWEAYSGWIIIGLT